MKSASSALQTFLASNRQFVAADLYTFTLYGGATLRYSSSGRVENYGGQSYLAGPRMKRSGFSQKRGLEVDTLTLNVFADERHVVNGVPLLTFIQNRGLDRAIVSVTTVYAADWASAWVGGILRFVGRVSEVPESGTTSATISIASGLEVLDTDMPCDLYQASCKSTLFDAKCGVDRACFQAAGTVAAGTVTPNGFPTSLTAAAGYYALGTMLFTSGPNAGQRRTVRAQDANGNLVLVAPFPATPAAGDSFTIWPGCDQSKARCSSFFNNLGRFRGEPYIPIPETIMGGVGGANTAAVQPGGGGNVPLLPDGAGSLYS